MPCALVSEATPPSLNFSLDWQLVAHMFALEGSQRKAILTPTSTPKLNAVLKANAVVGESSCRQKISCSEKGCRQLVYKNKGTNQAGSIGFDVQLCS